MTMSVVGLRSWNNIVNHEPEHVGEQKCECEIDVVSLAFVAVKIETVRERYWNPTKRKFSD
jgi:hypothetical protein